MNLVLIKEKVTQKQTRMRLGALLGGFALSFASLGGCVSPFGLALLCASDAYRLPLLGGCLLALPFCGSGKAVQLFCLLGCFTALAVAEKRGAGLNGEAKRKALLSDEPSEKPVSVRTRVTIACAAGLLTVLGQLLFGDSLSDTVLTALLSLCIPLFSLLFYGFLHKGKLYDLSLLGVCFALVQIFVPFTVASVPLALPVGMLLTLAVARNKGFAYGCAAGLLCGLTVGGDAMGALGVTGMTYGLLVNGIEGPALLLAYMIAVSGYWYLGGGVGILPAALMMAASCLLFLPLRRYVTVKAPPAAAPLSVKDVRLEKYAAAFSSLSGLFYTVSENAAPQTVDQTVRGIRTVVQAFCRNCEGCDLEEGELCNCMVDRMREKGIVHVPDLPIHIVKRCPSIRAMAKTVNRLPVLKEQESEKGIRRMAAEYANLSSLLDAAARREEAARIEDKPAAARVRQALKDMKISFDSVRVTGTRMRVVEVFGVRMNEISVSSARISATLSEQVGVKLSEPSFQIGGEYAVMKLTAVACVRTEFAKCTASKSGERICGDTVSFFETDDGYFYCLLSDGMGSGRDAALSSRLAALMLEKLLTVGADKADALQMLNKALQQKDKEVFATVDLLEIDRYTGTATLIKAGAAPTLLFRNGNCRRFESKTPPAGIMRDVIAEKRTFTVHKGDLLVLLSDGVLQTGEHAGEKLTVPTGSAHAVAGKLLAQAREQTACADDMSVCAIKIA